MTAYQWLNDLMLLLVMKSFFVLDLSVCFLSGQTVLFVSQGKKYKSFWILLLVPIDFRTTLWRVRYLQMAFGINSNEMLFRTSYIPGWAWKKIALCVIKIKLETKLPYTFKGNDFRKFSWYI